MINKKFEAYKLKRELKKSGETFEFFRDKMNEFGEPIDLDNKESVGSLIGLYHEQSSTIQVTTGDVAQTRSKKIPSILCLHEDVKNLDLNMNDKVYFNNHDYRVLGIVNVQEWNIIDDISLEVFDYGDKDKLQ